MSRAGLSGEARFELAMAAAARERRNAPMHLVYLAGLVVVIAALAALVEFRSWSRAGRDSRAAMARQAEVAAQVKEYVELKGKNGGAEKERTGFDKMVSTGERLATKAGLATPAKPREPDKPEIVPSGGGNVVKRTWAYAGVGSPQAGPLMEWVRSMLEEMPGLRVSGVRVKPGTEGWKMDVTYAVAERAGGGK